MKKNIFYKSLLLILLATFVSAKAYRGAELRTIDSYRYGRFETRMKSAPNSGVVSSMFTYHELGSAGVEDWCEVDIEFLGRYTDKVQFNTITNWEESHEHLHELDYDPATEFHVYAFEWTPNYVAWFVDGEEVFRQTGGHITLMDRAAKFMMNIWPPNYPDWVGNFNSADLPSYAIYDWARYYAYVPGTGNTGTGNDFIQLWHDDFESWNTSRWQKATHTWDGNNCDFIHANAVFQGGFFILCLTTPTATGYRGPTLPVDSEQGALPEKIHLSPAYPNPFNGTTNFTFEHLEPGSLTMDIIDTQGQILSSRVFNKSAGGFTSLSWDGNNDLGHAVPSGSYICRVRDKDGAVSRKLLLLK